MPDDNNPKASPGFHPLFATKNPVDTIFESSDGVRFCYDWDLLARLSTFFKDLKSVDTFSKASTQTEDEVIPLPTTSIALAYALKSVNTTLRGALPPTLELCHFEDVLTLADSLDLPIVARALLHTAEAAKRKPCVLATLTVLLGDFDEFKSRSLALLACPTIEMTEWSKSTLKRRAPHALLALYDLHDRWRKALGALVKANQCYPEFSRTCKRGGCNNNTEFDGDFRELVACELETVAETLAESPHLVLVPFYKAKLNCNECNRRVGNAVDNAIRRSLNSSCYTLAL
jgi:hypothetical protein